MTIPNSAVHTQLWKKIYTLIATISDPSSKTKWVYGAFPELKIDKPADYPLIVVSPVEITYNPETFTNVKSGPARVTIDLYSTNSSELDTLTDSIVNKMEDNDSAFTISGVSGIRLTGNSYTEYPRSTFRVHNKTFTYEFDYWWF